MLQKWPQTTPHYQRLNFLACIVSKSLFKTSVDVNKRFLNLLSRGNIPEGLSCLPHLLEKNGVSYAIFDPLWSKSNYRNKFRRLAWSKFLSYHARSFEEKVALGELLVQRVPKCHSHIRLVNIWSQNNSPLKTATMYLNIKQILGFSVCSHCFLDRGTYLYSNISHTAKKLYKSYIMPFCVWSKARLAYFSIWIFAFTSFYL